MFDELEQDKIQNFESAPAQESATEAPKVEESTVKSESERDKNLRYLRERAERAEKEIEEMKKYRQETKREADNQANQIQPPAGSENDLNIDDDSYIEAKYVKQLKREIQETKQQLMQMNQNNQQSNAEMKLKTEFPDIYDVVTDNNLKDLKAIRPDIFETIMYNPDLYKRGKLMREMIQDHVLSEKYEAQDKRLEENRVKPRSSASVPTQQADTPLTRVGDYDRRTLSPQRIEQLRVQVREAKKNKV